MKSYKNDNKQDQSQNTSFDAQFVPNMLKDDKKQQPKKPLIQFKYHPGFLCFFQDYVIKKDWTYYECFQKVFQTHHEIMKLRNPIKSIMNNKDLQKTQIINELMYRSQKGKKFAYFKKKQNDQLQCNVIVHEDRRIQAIENLKKQLAKLQKIKEKVIQNKKIEFQNKQLKRKEQRIKQAEDLMNQKQRRAHLVRQIQKQAEHKRREREEQKLKNTYNQGSSNILGNSNNSQCNIM